MSVVNDGLMAIGTFSRASMLSVKALRAYHEAGILVPARIDPATGYRSYHATQLTVSPSCVIPFRTSSSTIRCGLT